jgi:hypothetical protein
VDWVQRFAGQLGASLLFLLGLAIVVAAVLAPVMLPPILRRRRALAQAQADAARDLGES